MVEDDKKKLIKLYKDKQKALLKINKAIKDYNKACIEYDNFVFSINNTVKPPIKDTKTNYSKYLKLGDLCLYTTKASNNEEAIRSITKCITEKYPFKFPYLSLIDQDLLFNALLKYDKKDGNSNNNCYENCKSLLNNTHISYGNYLMCADTLPKRTKVAAELKKCQDQILTNDYVCTLKLSDLV